MAQLHVHSSDQRVPQKSGTRDRRRNRHSCPTRYAQAPSLLPANLSLGTNRNPVLSSEPTIWTLPQFLETDHAHA
jgi:hypothetical protein